MYEAGLCEQERVVRNDINYKEKQMKRFMIVVLTVISLAIYTNQSVIAFEVHNLQAETDQKKESKGKIVNLEEKKEEQIAGVEKEGIVNLEEKKEVKATVRRAVKETCVQGVTARLLLLTVFLIILPMFIVKTSVRTSIKEAMGMFTSALLVSKIYNMLERKNG
ncbi:MAG: hypothetical protein LBR09_02955 [Endomicrobium sp.]|jgi:hypothetical protein|nr:hypothetical protein [Endomicrobium sp.]